MVQIIDVSYACGTHARDLTSAGVRTVIRYYSRDTGLPTKRLTHAEAQDLAAAGLGLGIVHEARHGDRITSFSKALGLLDGAYARRYGAHTIGQPAGSAIYFGVDLDPSPAQIQSSVLPYFQGVSEAFAATGEADYRIGVYGSGRTCAAILDAGLAQLAWLAQATGWADYAKFKASKRWRLLQGKVTDLGEINCDLDEANPDEPDFGGFSLPGGGPVSLGQEMRVNARSGLRLRAGAGVEFDVLRLLPAGAHVHALKRVGEWSMVDLQGDGMADGFVSSAYLLPVTA